MSRSDDLQSIIRNTLWGLPFADVLALTEALEKAGWGPWEPVEVRSLEELESYPSGTIIRSGSGPVYHRTHPGYFTWSKVGTDSRYPSEVIYLESAPLYAVYVPPSAAAPSINQRTE